MEIQSLATHVHVGPQSRTGILPECEMTMAWLRKWLGGRVRAGRLGREVWVIERMVGGHPYSITLEAASEREALAELALFERDPGGYRTKRRAAVEADASAVRVGAESVGMFLAHLKDRGRSKPYRADTRGYLQWWAERLGARDLRAVDLSDLNRLLDEVANRKGRIIALKSFCTFMRERGELRRQDDPTLDLLVPTPVPEKNRRLKGHSMDAARRVYRALESQQVRDVLRVRWSTGMHLSEVRNLVEAGEMRDLEGYGEIAGLLVFWHKTQKQHVVAVEAATLAAAKRLKAVGSLPWRNWLQEQIDTAAGAANVKPPPALGEMRHSWTGWAKDHGVKVMPAKHGLPLADVAAVLGHASPDTTKRFYDVTTVPPMVWVPELKLEHPEDPLAAAARAARGGGR